MSSTNMKKTKEATRIIKPPMEVLYQAELDSLYEWDKDNEKPENWCLSPKAVKLFILGGNIDINHMSKSKELTKKDENKKNITNNQDIKNTEDIKKNENIESTKKVTIKKKFYGDDFLIERCIITLASNQGLMLVGEPGTAKTMLSELLSAAISGNSVNTIQGTSGTTDDNIKYSWNYAILMAKGPIEEALVPAPLYTGMKEGMITRFEELTRCPLEVQDSLISVMSDKVLNIPEFGEKGYLFANPGFNIIATANIRDKGVNEMSSALKRRFNFETVFPVNNVALESKIIEEQCKDLIANAGIDMEIDKDVVNIIATAFHELREGKSEEGVKIDSPSAIMSTAEAVSVVYQTALSANYFNEGKISPENLVPNIIGSIIKENRDDTTKLKSYFNTIIKKRADKDDLWNAFYKGRQWIR